MSLPSTVSIQMRSRASALRVRALLEELSAQSPGPGRARLNELQRELWYNTVLDVGRQRLTISVD